MPLNHPARLAVCTHARLTDEGEKDARRVRRRVFENECRAPGRRLARYLQQRLTKIVVGRRADVRAALQRKKLLVGLKRLVSPWSSAAAAAPCEPGHAGSDPNAAASATAFFAFFACFLRRAAVDCGACAAASSSNGA